MSFNLLERSGLPYHRRPSQVSSLPRPPIAVPMKEHLHRSMPVPSFFDIGTRDPRDPRLMGTPFEARSGMDGADYFPAMAPSIGLGSLGSGQRNPFPPGFEPVSISSGPEQYVDEMVRRTNLMVQFVNSQIGPNSRYCELQPKMGHDGKFPPEFRVGKTVNELRAMDPSSVDRVLRAYNLPTDLRSFRATPYNKVHPRAAHQAKLCTLFDFLGATQISERQRVKRNNGVSYQ